MFGVYVSCREALALSNSGGWCREVGPCVAVLGAAGQHVADPLDAHLVIRNDAECPFWGVCLARDLPHLVFAGSWVLVAAQPNSQSQTALVKCTHGVLHAAGYQ